MNSQNNFIYQTPINPYEGRRRTKTMPVPVKTISKTTELEPTLPTLPTPLRSSTAHLKMSIRLPKGIVTSLTIKKNIIALWLLYTSNPDYLDVELLCTKEGEDIKLAKDRITKMIMDFVYKCLNDWDKESGRGLSDFVTEKMLEDFLDDYEVYTDILPFL